MTGNARLVYSTDSGRVCPTCAKPAKSCSCKRKKATTQNKINLDGIIHIRREKKGRKGKTVTTVSGFSENTNDLKQIAKRLKNKCGTGGSAKGGVIIIQGDHRQSVQAYLEEHGFKVKLAGR